jgi:hypothetical protein
VLLSENASYGCWFHVLGQSKLDFTKLTDNYFAVPCFHSSGVLYISIDPGKTSLKENELSVL